LLLVGAPLAIHGLSGPMFLHDAGRPVFLPIRSLLSVLMGLLRRAKAVCMRHYIVWGRTAAFCHHRGVAVKG